MVFVALYQRTSSSYDVALQQYLDRVAAGLQPSTSIVDLFNVETEEALLLSTNFLYLGMVIVLYMKMLKRSKPVRLRALMLGYNTLNVCVSLYVACSLLFFKIRSRGGEHGGGFVCNPLRTDAEGQGVAQVFAVFYLQKYLELVDTVLFLLRRSFRQVTFFHLFHHCSITVIVGSVLPFDFNGDMYLPIMLNSIVHVLVYLHYVLAALGKHSWWSRYLTSLQLAQFLVIFVQSATAFYVGPTCGSPDFVKVVLLLYMGSLLGLFALFFAKRSLVGPAEDPGMCGVIKSLENDGAGRRGPPLSWHGNAALNGVGSARVKLPTSFSHEPSARAMYSYQLTPIGAAMPGLYISEEISSAGGKKERGFSFYVKGGKPRSTISWMVTRVWLQQGGDSDDEDSEEVVLGREGRANGTGLTTGEGTRIPRSSAREVVESWGASSLREGLDGR